MTEDFHDDIHRDLDRDEALVISMLRKADAESSVPGGVREQTRAAVFIAFDDMVKAQHGSARQGPTAEVIAFDEHATRTESVPPARRLSFLVAVAAMLVVIVGSLALFSSSKDRNRLLDSANAGRSSIDVGDDGLLSEPARLEAGPLISDALGPSVSFTLEQPLWLVREGNGVIELAVDPNDPSEARVWLLGPETLELVDGFTSIQQLMDAHPDNGAQMLPSLLAERQGKSWALRDSGRQSCAIDELCTPMVAEPVEVGLVTGRFTHVFQVPVDDAQPDGESLVIVVWTTSDWTSNLRGEPFNEDLLASLQIEPNP